MSVRLTLDRQDPVLGALIDHASKQECSLVRRRDVLPAKAETLRSKVFDERQASAVDGATRAAGIPRLFGKLAHAALVKHLTGRKGSVVAGLQTAGRR
jgi:hypothetical protein